MASDCNAQLEKAHTMFWSFAVPGSASVSGSFALSFLVKASWLVILRQSGVHEIAALSDVKGNRGARSAYTCRVGSSECAQSLEKIKMCLLCARQSTKRTEGTV